MAGPTCGELDDGGSGGVEHDGGESAHSRLLAEDGGPAVQNLAALGAQRRPRRAAPEKSSL